MKQLIPLLALLVTLCEGQCPENWSRFQDYCLILNMMKTTWQNADNQCRTFGGHLAAIENESKENNMEAFLGINKYLAPVWTDGTDQLGFGHYVWAASGDAITYTKWFPTEPDLPRYQDCVALIHNTTFWWRTRPCTSQYSFVCEREIHKPGITIG